MNIEKNLILLIRILLYLEYLKLLNESARSLYTIQELDNLRTKVCFSTRCPVFKGPSVEEVKQHLRNIVEDSYHRVGLQTDIITVEERLSRERHHPAVLIDHWDETHTLKF